MSVYYVCLIVLTFNEEFCKTTAKKMFIVYFLGDTDYLYSIEGVCVCIYSNGVRMRGCGSQHALLLQGFVQDVLGVKLVIVKVLCVLCYGEWLGDYFT